MNEITPADVGRRVTFVRGIDWDWHAQSEGTIVLDVRTVYTQPPGIRVKIGDGTNGGYWYAMGDVRLMP
ncbi:MAG: hypothetical protein V3S14_11825 [Anaerolineae bacterium]